MQSDASAETNEEELEVVTLMWSPFVFLSVGGFDMQNEVVFAVLDSWA